MNARLQVEHGVTELVADFDIVHEQLWLAAGHPLSAAAHAVAAAAADPVRHAFELRISAEDPARTFAPTPGLSPAGASRRDRASGWTPASRKAGA